MYTTKTLVVDYLNDLVEINNDRIQGYQKAAAETNDTGLQQLFRRMASHSHLLKNELIEEIVRLDGNPTEGTKNTGKVFRAWMDVIAAVTGNERKVILGLCKYGEEAAIETYEDVLKTDTEFSDELRSKIVRQMNDIQKDHHEIAALIKE